MSCDLMSSPKMCLQWNNHLPNFVSAFKDLLKDEELVDVTLSVDGQKIKAHKVILSVCSPYFKQMFSANPCKHAVVVLSDIKFEDLKTIIEFMYFGEIEITDERLPDVLEVAQSLQVRGLFNPKRKIKSDGPAPKKKKKIACQNNTSSQKDVLDQSLEDDTSGNQSVLGSAVEKWVRDQDNENEFSTSLAPVSLTPSVSCEEEDNSIEITDVYYLGHPEEPSSPTDHSRAKPGRSRRWAPRDGTIYLSENFNLALEAVRTGQLGFCKAAKTYGVNNRSLWVEYKKRGYPSVRPQPEGLKLSQASGW